MTTRTIAPDQRPLIGLLFVISAAFAFSAKAVIIKVAYGYGAQITPIMMMALRMLMSLPFFVVAILIIERNKGSSHQPLTGEDKLRLLGLGIIGFYLAAFLDFLGLSYISASLERLILLLYPTLVVLLSAIFLRRAITLKEAMALLVSYLGILIVFYQELSLAGSNIMLGSALIFGSATAFAIYLIGSGEMIRHLGASRFTAYAMTIACIVTLFHFGVAFDAQVLALPIEVYGLALLMAVVSTVVPTFLMSAGIHHLGAGPASIISALGPVMTIFLAYMFLDEQLTAVQFLGAALVMMGVFVVSGKKKG